MSKEPLCCDVWIVGILFALRRTLLDYSMSTSSARLHPMSDVLICDEPSESWVGFPVTCACSVTSHPALSRQSESFGFGGHPVAEQPHQREKENDLPDGDARPRLPRRRVRHHPRVGSREFLHLRGVVRQVPPREGREARERRSSVSRGKSETEERT